MIDIIQRTICFRGLVRGVSGITAEQARPSKIRRNSGYSRASNFDDQFEGCRRNEECEREDMP